MLEQLTIAVHTRSRGHSAAAAVAYRCGLDVLDEPTGELHRYSHRRDHVVYAGYTGGKFANADAWARAIEAAEKRKDSQLVRDVVTALPCELSPQRQVALAKQWARHLSAEHRTSVLYAVHKPEAGGEGDDRNVHVHAVLPTRQLSAPDRFEGGAKLVISPENIRHWRESWIAMQREALATALDDEHDGIAIDNRPAVGLYLAGYEPDSEQREHWLSLALDATVEERRQAVREALDTGGDGAVRSALQAQLADVHEQAEALIAEARHLNREAAAAEDLAMQVALSDELAALTAVVDEAKKARKRMRTALTRDHKRRKRAVALATATAAGHPDPETEADDALAHPQVHLGATAVAAERKAARTRDREAAKAEGRTYQPVRRTAAQLLAYTGGVSERGREWLSAKARGVYVLARQATRRLRTQIQAVARRLNDTQLTPALEAPGAPKAPPIRKKEIHEEESRAFRERIAALDRARGTPPERQPAAPQPVVVVAGLDLPLGPAPPADNTFTTREPKPDAPDPEPTPKPTPTQEPSPC